MWVSVGGGRARCNGGGRVASEVRAHMQTLKDTCMRVLVKIFFEFMPAACTYFVRSDGFYEL